MRLIGILNITQDSFSDGGKYVDIESATEHTLSMIRAGASIIDVGAESTSPHACTHRISTEEELSRIENVLPQIIKICQDHGVESSIDTRRALVISFALKHKIDYINDVSGGSQDILELISKHSHSKIIASHGLPAIGVEHVQRAFGTFEQVLDWATYLIDRAAALGIEKNRIVIDPGIGFGKDSVHSWNLIKKARVLKEKLDIQMCIGHSRKSFMWNGLTPIDYDLETIVVSTFLYLEKMDFVRIHNVDIHRRMLETLRKVMDFGE